MMRTRPRSSAAIRHLLLYLTIPLIGGSALAGVGDLCVTSDASDVVGIYGGASGVYQGNLLASNSAMRQLGIHFGSSNNRVLIGHMSGGVEEFDATTGAYIKTYNASSDTQWAGLYGPSGSVLIGDSTTNDVREYNSTTGALVQVLTSVSSPADMRIGPNGDLYICSYGGGFVLEVNATSGAFVNQWSQPAGAQTNDIAFNPNGEILVTAMRTNVVYRYDSSLNLLGSFAGTGWGRTHGIEISPWSGNVLVADGVTAQVHEFNPSTYVELTPSFLSPAPSGKIVDLAFCPNKAPLLPFCSPGVAGVVACPCSNPPVGVNRGCDNFAGGGTGGAALSGSGLPVTNVGDSLEFSVTAGVGSNVTVLFQGTTNTVNTRSGAGVRCVGGNLKRLFRGNQVSGAIGFPNNGVNVHDQSTAKGYTIVAPITLYYYCAYRNSAANGQPGCPGLTFGFNTTNAGAVAWTP